MSALRALLRGLIDATVGVAGLIAMLAAGLVLLGASFMGPADWGLGNAAIVLAALACLVCGFWLYGRGVR